jgi:murein DD-endopeptidase MepM/ murein hydrolase activator NlpD
MGVPRWVQVRKGASACAVSAVACVVQAPSPKPASRTVPPPVVVIAEPSAQPPPEIAQLLVAAPQTATPTPSGPRSPLLREPRFHSPMPGGYVGGWSGDTGLDVAGNRLPVYAIAAGTLDYSERGHTLWMTAPDTPFSVRIALDEPVPYNGGHRVTHVYYTHLSHLEFEQPEGAPTRIHVEAGERIGTSGIGNGVPHLHLGLLLDGLVEQDTWDGILREQEVRRILGGYKNGELLPKVPRA